MTPELEKQIQACPHLPSPPTVAVEIIKLVNEPEIDFKKLTNVLNCDPALCGKILRIANSPLYPYSKKIENLNQALMVLGLNATVSLALSFSLMKSLKASKGSGLDYELYWRRALFSGAICRVLGANLEATEVEAMYLASLLQDLGMLVLDQVFPDLYATFTGDQTAHALVIEFEQHHIGETHTVIGSWLLTQWNFPARLRLAVSGSDSPTRIPSQDDRAPFTYCVALSGKIAELFLRECNEAYFQEVQELAHQFLGLTPEKLLEVLETVNDQLPELGQIFETDLQPWSDSQTILDHARDSLLHRTLQTLRQVEELQINTATMEAQFSTLEEIHRHDTLTGTLTRAYLDRQLERSFEEAKTRQEPLTLVFGDLDKFKSVNDTYGHQVGDLVLKSAARLLLSKLRTTDMVGRYGGEEFVLILPKAPYSAAKMVCERILAAFRETTHEVAPEQRLSVTISLGIATHTPDEPYSNVSDLLQSADEAVYYSKTHGGNRFTFFDIKKQAQPA